MKMKTLEGEKKNIRQKMKNKERKIQVRNVT